MDVASWMRWTTWTWLCDSYYYVVYAYLFYMMMLLWMVYKALIGENSTKIFNLQTSWMAGNFKASVVFFIWYQSEVETLGPIGLKTLQQVLF